LFAVPFPMVIAAAAVIGWLLGRIAPQLVHPPIAEADPHAPAPLIADDVLHADRPSAARAGRVLLVGLVAWGVPVLVVVLAIGRHSTVTTEGLFFSGTALVTFGGAYAVLSFVAHRAVEVYGWLAPRDMVRGLALAETTPGPLIMVVQFVAFVAAYRHPGTLDPWAAAFIGALLTTWVTFVPCFVFIFLGAPYVERLRGNRSIGAALVGITAAVVGVIANLAFFFAVHTLFRETRRLTPGPIQLEIPVLHSARPLALGIAVVAGGLVFGLRWSVLRTLAVCALLGLLAAVTPLSIT
jgi:chromate transporter